MFIKKVTNALLETHLASLKASKEKLKTMAKEEKKLNDEEMKFYYTQMQQIYTGLIETQKQYDLITKELLKETQRQLDQYRGEINETKDNSKI